MALEPAAPQTPPPTTEAPQQRPWQLPIGIVGSVEISRLQRELSDLDDYLLQAGLRTPGKQVRFPKVSSLLETTASENSKSLLKVEDRKSLAEFLQKTVETAPNVHISFATDPSPNAVAQIVSWLRSSVHPYVLVRIGLQPNIAAGCVLRTSNKQFDFSLRNRFDQQHALLTDAIGGRV